MEKEKQKKKKPNRRGANITHAYIALLNFCNKNNLTVRAVDSTAIFRGFKRPKRTYEILRGDTVIVSATFQHDSALPICPPERARYGKQHYACLETLLFQTEYLVESAVENFYSGEVNDES